MAKPINTDSIHAATGRSWEDWLTFMHSVGADKLTHKEIAKKVLSELEGQDINAGWWAQSITVAYEQHTGRRAPGQTADGFQVSTSATMPGTPETFMRRWQGSMDAPDTLKQAAYADGPKTTVTAKWHHWRAGFAGGSRVSVSATQKHTGTILVTIAHTKLPDAAAAALWRDYWQDALRKLRPKP